MKNDAPIDAAGGDRSSTPLHLAAEKDNHAIIKLILEYGANPTKKDSDGKK